MSDLVGNPEDRFSRVAAQMRPYSAVDCSIKYNHHIKEHMGIMSRDVRKPTKLFPNRSDETRAVQAQKGYKLEILDLESKGTVLLV